MEFTQPLVKGKLIKRYKRFMADAELENGEVVTAHCPNTGSMMGLTDAGNGVWLSPADNPERKLKYTLEMIDVGTSRVGVHTGRPNHIVANAIKAGKVEGLHTFQTVEMEKKYGKNSRIDILLSNPEEESKCYVEVKNVTLRDGEAALFPDAVTARGAKHLDELVEMKKQGHRVVMFYLVQRTDCAHFAPADAIDPTYGEKLRHAVENGLEVLAYTCNLTDTSITLNTPLEVKL